ncbi:response regulator [Legionella sp. km535]|uniref:response regulator n=1 Tax=Legionella sp. km535 TaxID=2498107 RepID=UPI000F8EF111|nr:response regulator [Legionella sp. km535]RUR17964.1 response regulator [Legionella sp. km535]
MSKKHILLVEDNTVAAQVAKFLFETLGCDVDVVSDGIQALLRAEQTDFDAICMDIGLPSVSGLDACKMIREHEAKNKIACVPIIAVTGNASPEETQKYLAAGMQDVILKPLTKEKAEHLLTFCKK